mmetsp:Transcript_27858/g.65810  ORF Transcript_27858/g.65810 Transcript_27858/m.65810 type:complete len:221 (-) Transcript_27858:126-788(-)
MVAFSLRARQAISVVRSSSSLARSHLLTRIVSAVSSCCSSSSTTRRSTAHGSALPTSSPARSARSPATCTVPYSSGNELASTSATLRSTFTPPMSRLDWTLIGSATPLSSTTTWSKGGSVRSSSAITAGARSPEPGPQQTQPFSSCTISTPSSSMLVRRIAMASTLTSATSFTSTAIRRPSRLVRRCVSVVVFPAPRNPPSSVVGGRSTLAPTLVPTAKV